MGPGRRPVVQVTYVDGSLNAIPVLLFFFRKVNWQVMIKRDAQPLPRVDDTLDTAKLNQLTKRKPPLPLHMGCISSVPWRLSFAMPLEHSNN